MGRNKKEKFDKLAWEVSQALSAGMSYGKWKALQTPVPVIEVKDVKNENEIACAYCGKVFIPRYNKRKKYCDDRCAHQASCKRRRERMNELNEIESCT